MDDLLKKDIDFWLKKISEKNSESALKSLYEYYYGKLMRFVLIYTKSEQVAEEIIGDVFLSIWENRKSIPEIKNFNAYIYTMAKNMSIDYLRKNKLSFEKIEDIPFDLYFRTETTPEDDLISQEQIKRLDEAIETLPNQCKMAFKLIREDNLKYKDAAEVLNVSVKTLEAHMTKAIKMLRQAINLLI